MTPGSELHSRRRPTNLIAWHIGDAARQRVAQAEGVLFPVVVPGLHANVGEARRGVRVGRSEAGFVNAIDKGIQYISTRIGSATWPEVEESVRRSGEGKS